MLYTKDWLDNHLHTLLHWQQTCYVHFKNMMENKTEAYPCVPGQHGFSSNQLRFAFAANPLTSQAPEDLANALEQYGYIARETGKYASIVVFFETPSFLVNEYTMKQYEQLFWSLLNKVNEMDTVSWPEHINTDPEHSTWEFCYNGEPYFAFCATPAHELRKSRYFPAFMMAFQPRFVFELINDKTVFGRNMKKMIRGRLQTYDKVPVHPSLQWYGQEGNLEWKQYFLPDDNTLPSKCPFAHFHSNKTGKCPITSKTTK